jgi:hypothetical protein
MTVISATAVSLNPTPPGGPIESEAAPELGLTVAQWPGTLT